jgi:hypothetical protein
LGLAKRTKIKLIRKLSAFHAEDGVSTEARA